MVQDQLQSPVELTMPVTAKKNNGDKRIGILAGVLAKALDRPEAEQANPILVENVIRQTKSAHVVAIWDQWSGLSAIQRSQALLEAYAKSKRLPGCTITVAMGLTGMEAFQMGFLPYGIVPMRRQGDKRPAAQLSKAMHEVNKIGGVELKVGSETQLRFPTLEQAKEAYRHLSAAVPGPYWAIFHDPSTIE